MHKFNSKKLVIQTKNAKFALFFTAMQVQQEVRQVFVSQKHSYSWIDVVYPDRKLLEKLADEYELHETSVEDCLDPEHLPKIEFIDDTTFIIARAYDDLATPQSDTVQELTRKLAIFIGTNFVLTIHRIDQAFFLKILDEWKNKQESLDEDEYNKTNKDSLVIDILNQIVLSYEKAIKDADLMVDKFEIRIFSAHSDPMLIQELYYFKRKITVIRKMLRQTQDIVRILRAKSENYNPAFQDLKESIDEFLFLTEELTEDSNNLINIHISLASHKTNEVVKVLTLFSVFFLPITFIVGVYGMNFKFMPELEHPLGYPLVWLTMIMVVLTIYIWFRRKGWM